MSARELSVEDLLKNASFQRWATGVADDEERRRWDEWIRQRIDRRATVHEAARIIQLARFKSSDAPGSDVHDGADDADVDAAWERLQRARRRGERRSASRASARGGSPDDKRAGERVPVQPSRRRVAARTWGRRAAAALVVVLVGLGLWWTGMGLDWNVAPAETTIQTDYNERASLTLPGGTDIMLNANSRLRILTDGDGEPKGEVYLDGEAFFDVARAGKGADRRPFVVRTDDGTVRVLGTRFTVARRARQTRVALNEGEVAVQAEYLAPSARQPATPGAAASKERTVMLRPGQLAAFGPDSEAIHVQEVNPAVYSSWTTGTLIFDETPIAVIAERIEHTYGLEVRVEDQDVLRETVSGQVENDLDVFISGLSRLLGRPIQRTGDAVIIQ